MKELKNTYLLFMRMAVLLMIMTYTLTPKQSFIHLHGHIEPHYNGIDNEK